MADSQASDSQTYDLIVIGAGPGGYVCAIRAAQLGLKTACVERAPTLGGTCLNVGCIPSKALLHASERYEEASRHLADFGIKTGKVTLDLPAMMAHKTKVVSDNTKGIEFLFRKNKVTWIKGTASLPAPGQVQVEEKTYRAKNIVIATGSESASLPGLPVDEKQILTSTGALDLPRVPDHLVVIGAGVIGLELGTVWRRLGARVTVVEYLDRILPGMDAEIAHEAQKILTKQGLAFKLGHKLAEAETSSKAVDLILEPAAGGPGEKLSCDAVLVAVGRKPNTQGLGLDALGVGMDERGRIKTGKNFSTNLPGLYAIGDVIAGPMLAHKAEDEGVLLAEALAGQWGEHGVHIDYSLIPGVVYTSPEIAQVGRTEEELKKASVAYTVGKFPFSANGRARAMNATEGFVKILTDSATDRILGVHILGAEAGTLIAEATLAMEFGATAEDLARTCHAHPTLEEVVKEAALAANGRALHI